MSQNFNPGDYLIFQLESGYGLLKLIGRTGPTEEPIWHLKAFQELFLDIESADLALAKPETLTVSLHHAALTNRAFLATQVSIMIKGYVETTEESAVNAWQVAGSVPTDSPIRMLLGLR